MKLEVGVVSLPHHRCLPPGFRLTISLGSVSVESDGRGGRERGRRSRVKLIGWKERRTGVEEGVISQEATKREASHKEREHR